MTLLDRLLFGRKFVYSPPHEQIRIARRTAITQNVILFALIAAFSVLLIFGNRALETPPVGPPVINTTDLSPEQAAEVLAIMDNVKPEWLVSQRSITFTTDLVTYTQANDPRAAKIARTLVGYNRWPKGEIVILYMNDQTSLNETICHELLHTYAKKSDESHVIVNDLEDYQACFKGTEPAGSNDLGY
jgi:hypothetical protein